MTIFLRPTLALGILASASLAGISSAVASSPCSGVDTKLTAQRQSDYAKLIAGVIKQKVKPSKIDVTAFMQAGTWTVVYADFPDAEPGYFFFDSSSGKPVFKDIWGGIADEGEGPQIAKWARDLGANKSIASCFADSTGG